MKEQRNDLPEIPFAKYESFSMGCSDLIKRYEGGGISDVELNEGGINRGWEWMEDGSIPDQGYLYRRVSRYIRYDIEGERHSEVKSSSIEPEQDKDEEELSQVVEDEQLEEGIEDEAIAKSPISLKSTTQTESDIKDQTEGKTLNDINHNVGQQLQRIDMEQYIIYSKTYKSPEFVFRAFDNTGALLSVDQLLSSKFLRPIETSPTQSSNSNSDSNSNSNSTSTSTSTSTGSQLPMIQSTRLPSTGELLLGIHPYRLSEAVEQILQNATPSTGSESHWLECWLVLTNNVVDLSYP
ncbi:uncharacterized protein IL334_005353 [Kwoniella shivajii]|uniref:Ubiquitin-like-conjugating enzyme ATG10 n=1 Tax=Kwoniella shivajii TaxID=564305 RepID=A0ABZ1D2Z2_9TREE|nr:hypothetical protein IL334_005353 [Kwoniella shivajii]